MEFARTDKNLPTILTPHSAIQGMKLVKKTTQSSVTRRLVTSNTLQSVNTVSEYLQ